MNRVSHYVVLVLLVIGVAASVVVLNNRRLTSDQRQSKTIKATPLPPEQGSRNTAPSSTTSSPTVKTEKASPVAAGKDKTAATPGKTQVVPTPVKKPPLSQGNTGETGVRQTPPSREEMARIREEQKYHFQLMRQVGNIARLDRDGNQPLTGKQARQILDVLTPLRTREKLNEDEAKDTIIRLQQILTVDQRTEIGNMTSRRFGGGGEGPGGSSSEGSPSGPPDGGPGGPSHGAFNGPPPGRPAGSGQGRHPGFNPAATKDFNPFKTKEADPMTERWDAFFKALEAKAQK